MLKKPYAWDDGVMPRAATGETPKRNLRIETEIWEAAQARAAEEKRTMTAVVKSYLARYGAELPADAPDANPWDVVNFVVASLGLKLGPDTNLQLAAAVAAELLRTLGVRPMVESNDGSAGAVLDGEL
jgi:hypothetical protein